MACSGTCGGTQASLGNCTPILRKGGGVRLVGYTCDTVFTSITDSAEWGTYFGTSKAFYSPAGKINKDKGSPQTAQITSSQTAVTGWQETVKFISYDSEINNSDYDFYESLQEKGGAGLVLGYLTEDDLLYILPDVSVQPNDVREENSKTGLTYWDMDLVYVTKFAVKPISVPDLNKVINALIS